MVAIAVPVAGSTLTRRSVRAAIVGGPSFTQVQPGRPSVPPSLLCGYMECVARSRSAAVLVDHPPSRSRLSTRPARTATTSRCWTGRRGTTGGCGNEPPQLTSRGHATRGTRPATGRGGWQGSRRALRAGQHVGLVALVASRSGTAQAAFDPVARGVASLGYPYTTAVWRLLPPTRGPRKIARRWANDVSGECCQPARRVGARPVGSFPPTGSVIRTVTSRNGPGDRRPQRSQSPWFRPSLMTSPSSGRKPPSLEP
jgi:hypothetical protein